MSKDKTEMSSELYSTFGYALAMRVLQSELYEKLDDKERGECDELIARGLKRQPEIKIHPLDILHGESDMQSPKP